MSLRDRVGESELLARVRSRDRYLIIATMLAIYLVYIGIGVVLGFGLNGQVNALVRLTFLVAAYTMAGLALNLHWGYTGLFNVGVVGFIAIAIYVMGITTAPPDPATAAATPGLGLHPVVGILLGTVAAAVVGLIVAFPALRLRADYFAIVTLGMAEIVRLSLTSNTLKEFTVFGVAIGTGANGGLNLAGDPSKAMQAFYETGYGVGPLRWVAKSILSAFGAAGITRTVVVQLTYVCLLIVFAWGFYWTFWRIGKSPFGRVLKAIREDEEVANSLGKNVQLTKIKAFVIGAALLGLAGIFWQGSRGLATPNTFKTEVTVFVWVVVILGGSGSNTGTVIGSALFVSLLLQGPRYLRNVILETTTLPNPPLTVYRALVAVVGGDPVVFVSFLLARLASLQFVILGVVLIYLVHRRPQGLLGHRKEVAATLPLARPRSDAADRPPAATTEPDSNGGDEDE